MDTCSVGITRPPVQYRSCCRSSSSLARPRCDPQCRLPTRSINRCSSQTFFNSSRFLAESTGANVRQTIRSTNDVTQCWQDKNTKELADRGSDILFWKGQILTEIEEMNAETEKLEELKKELQELLQLCKCLAETGQECLRQRERRTEVDQVPDDVVKCMAKEAKIVRRCALQLEDLLQKIQCQLGRNHTVQRVLELNCQDKCQAYDIDIRMAQLSNSSSGINSHPGIESVDNTKTNAATWLHCTKCYIDRSQTQREASEKLREKRDTCMRQCSNQLWAAYHAVIQQLEAKIRENTNAKRKLQSQLQKTDISIHQMDKTLEKLRQSINDKETPMKVAQTRLCERLRRVHIENCYDQPMIGLKCEVEQLKNSLRTLKEQLKQAEAGMCRLLKTRTLLQSDIEVKENSIQIDSKCLQCRRERLSVEPGKLSDV